MKTFPVSVCFFTLFYKEDYKIMNKNTDNLIITKHAYLRLKQRNGWNKRTSDRMLQRVYEYGVRGMVFQNSDHDSGDLEEYIIYGDKLYIFKGYAMITTYTAKRNATSYYDMTVGCTH